MQKQYSKLTADQFRGFIDHLPEFQKMAIEMRDVMQKAPESRWKELLKEDYSWAWIYEFPLVVHIALCMKFFNLVPWLEEVGKAPDPQQKILDDFGKELSDDFHPDIEVQDGLAMMMSISRTVQSILMYGRSLSSLIQEFRDKDDLDSLFKAIKLDRTVVSCPCVADRISKAEIQNDKAFFRRLSNSFKGPSQKEWAGLSGMKFSFNLLRDFEINDLSDEGLEHLMVHVLDVYKDVPGARKNLRMHYQNSRKLKTI